MADILLGDEPTSLRRRKPNDASQEFNIPEDTKRSVQDREQPPDKCTPHKGCKPDYKRPNDVINKLITDSHAHNQDYINPGAEHSENNTLTVKVIIRFRLVFLLLKQLSRE